MRLLLVFLTITTLLFSCRKKEKNSAVDNTSQATTAELSSPFLESNYGAAYDYNITNNPLSLLSSNDLIVSSLQYDGVTDKLQITKINSSGNVLWQKIMTQGYKYIPGNCFETSAGQLIIFGATIAQSNWVDSKVFIAKLNATTGDTLWTRSYGHNYIDRGIIGCEDSNNNYWVVDFSQQDHKATLLKIAPNGDSLTSVINSETNQPSYEDAIISSNKNIIIVGESGNFASSKTPIYMCSYSLTGIKNFSSHIELNNFDQIKVNDVCETSDGSFVVAGECFNFANTSLRYGFLLKIDNYGNKVWERILSQFNNSAAYSILEKQPGVFYLGLGSSGNGKLYKYDLSNLSEINLAYITNYHDIQLLKNGTKLYRALIDANTGGYETVKLKAYTIN
jgi:hypothetical protein